MTPHESGLAAVRRMSPTLRVVRNDEPPQSPSLWLPDDEPDDLPTRLTLRQAAIFIVCAAVAVLGGRVVRRGDVVLADRRMVMLFYRPVFVGPSVDARFRAVSKDQLRTLLREHGERIVGAADIVEGPDGFHIEALAPIARSAPL